MPASIENFLTNLMSDSKDKLVVGKFPNESNPTIDLEKSFSKIFLKIASRIIEQPFKTTNYAISPGISTIFLYES